jgi:hypothetical protein
VDAQTDIRRVVGRLAANARDLDLELNWFSEVLAARLGAYFDPQQSQHFDFSALPPPVLSGADSSYGAFASEVGLSAAERLVLVLALIPYMRPQLLDILWKRNAETDRGFTEFGGLRGAGHGGFLPTVETALFLLAGDDLEQRLAAMEWLSGDGPLLRESILDIQPAQGVEPWTSAALAITRETCDRIASGYRFRPLRGAQFPARLIRTSLDWDHLVLPEATLSQLNEIRDWILHGHRLLDEWGFRDKIAPGFTSLLHGPSGTGKTTSACLLGKHCGCEVFKIDLSLMVSKYIGETEKNLARIFDAAENRRWILFFDEADALFGKRTRVSDSHDRYANQEVSYLLQRIEEFGGVVILASNLKTNIDDAFVRRLQSVIRFPMPQTADRLKIWQSTFSDQTELQGGLELREIAEKHEVSGGTIVNVVRFASLRSMSRGSRVILRDDIEEGLRRELAKEGRSL